MVNAYGIWAHGVVTIFFLVVGDMRSKECLWLHVFCVCRPQNIANTDSLLMDLENFRSKTLTTA